MAGWIVEDQVDNTPVSTASNKKQLNKNNNKKRKRPTEPPTTTTTIEEDQQQQQPSTSSSRQDITLNDIEWSQVSFPKDLILSDDLGGFLCLEEVEDVDVAYEEDGKGGKIMKFQRIDDGKKNKKKSIIKNNNNNKKAKLDNKKSIADQPLTAEEMKMFGGGFIPIDANLDKVEALKATGEWDELVKKTLVSDDEEEVEEVETLMELEEVEKVEEEVKPVEDEKKKKVEKKSDKPKESQQQPQQPKDISKTLETFDLTHLSDAWKSMNLSKPLLAGLAYQKFQTPTEIQTKSIPLALSGNDIIGAAETGSGKTLAFGLPILDAIVKSQESGEKLNSPMALIISPTRELSMQIRDHLLRASKFIRVQNRPVNIVALVGGMAIQKQQRLLAQQPQIIVATPGRLWELCDDAFLERLKKVRFLVIDEADKMLEKGSFKELENILRAISLNRTVDTTWKMDNEDVAGPDGNMKKSKRSKNATTKTQQNQHPRQTLIFSATLLDNDKLRQVLKGKKRQHSNTPTFEDLLQRLEFQTENPTYLNVLPTRIITNKVTETRIDCLPQQKDLYLSYLLTLYPSSHAIVFVNTIPLLRHLSNLLTYLHPKSEILTLHAQMPQKARLTALETFQSNTSSSSILLATDVASRGLDISHIDLVIHYDVPHTPELYIHRSGRTGRGGMESGVSVLFLSPSDVNLYKRILKALQTVSKGSKTEYVLDAFPVDLEIQGQIKKRLGIAEKIVKEEDVFRKKRNEKKWMNQLAEEAELDVPSDMEDDSDDDNNNNGNKKELQVHKARVNGWKAELKQLIAQPIVQRRLKSSYLDPRLVELVLGEGGGSVDKLRELGGGVIRVGGNKRVLEDMGKIMAKKKNSK